MTAGYEVVPQSNGEIAYGITLTMEGWDDKKVVIAATDELKYAEYLVTVLNAYDEIQASALALGKPL